jgi:hypothetical protein
MPTPYAECTEDVEPTLWHESQSGLSQAGLVLVVSEVCPKDIFNDSHNNAFHCNDHIIAGCVWKFGKEVRFDWDR